MVVDAAGLEGFGFRCFGGEGRCSLSAVAPAPSAVVGASGMEPDPGGSVDSSSSMSGRFPGSYSGGDDGDYLPTSLIDPINHLGWLNGQKVDASLITGGEAWPCKQGEFWGRVWSWLGLRLGFCRTGVVDKYVNQPSIRE